MATYAIGDLQGCYDALQRLLDKLQFDPVKDQLWLAGDLVNRGPDSLASLRFVKSLGDNAITVLGNHDLHLLAIAADHKTTKDPGLKEILAAADVDELIDWLRKQPLLHYDAQLDFALVHAGIYPAWTLQQAIEYAAELHQMLASDNYLDFIHHMYGNKPRSWRDELNGWDRLRFIVNSFTRMRYCDADGKLNLKDKGPIGSQRKGSLPWFDMPKRKSRKQRILFGHWSTAGRLNRENVYALDTGCIWGGDLTALQLDAEPPRYISIACPEFRHPKGLSEVKHADEA
jgi:bis(5'-nucleosyl)-tetraphosphatase (symmetrical)